MSQALASSPTPTKILVPIDFSSSSDAALAMATALAQRFGAELHLLHVVPMLPVINGVDDFPQMQYPLESTFMEESQGRAERSLAKCISPLISLGVKASSTAEIGSDVAGNILTTIKSQHIDMASPDGVRWFLVRSQRKLSDSCDVLWCFSAPLNRSKIFRPRSGRQPT